MLFRVLIFWSFVPCPYQVHCLLKKTLSRSEALGWIGSIFHCLSVQLLTLAEKQISNSEFIEKSFRNAEQTSEFFLSLLLHRHAKINCVHPTKNRLLGSLREQVISLRISPLMNTPLSKRIRLKTYRNVKKVFENEEICRFLVLT